MSELYLSISLVVIVLIIPILYYKRAILVSDDLAIVEANDSLLHDELKIFDELLPNYITDKLNVIGHVQFIAKSKQTNKLSVFLSPVQVNGINIDGFYQTTAAIQSSDLNKLVGQVVVFDVMFDYTTDDNENTKFRPIMSINPNNFEIINDPQTINQLHFNTDPIISRLYVCLNRTI